VPMTQSQPRDAVLVGQPTGAGEATRYVARRQTRKPSGEEHLRNGPPVVQQMRRQEVPAAGRQSISPAELGVDARVRTGTAPDASGLMVSVASETTGDIERDVRAELTAQQQLLHDSFARARRHTRGALAAVSADTMLINAAASRLLTSRDRARLWAWAAHHGPRATRGTPIRTTSGLVVYATAEPIQTGSHTIGAVIHLTIHREPPIKASGRSPSPPRRFGLASLTDTERGVAAQVATGQTNRQVGAALSLSPHTVDAHLRHIYAKLGITSRVQLVHVVLTDTDLSAALRPP
jgi:DNA-binding CsgD family transcriptional regulator